MLAIAACSDDGDNEEPSPTPGPATSAPSDVRIEGALPDLRTPVPPGQGELGRITVTWKDNTPDEDGFRIFQDCNGTQTRLVEVEANETRYGPLQVCRPGRVGVAAFQSNGQSDIAWSP
jgi:hypothetical protein